MKGTNPLITVLLLAVLGQGCATGVRVAFDEREDLSKYQTWNWLARESSKVEVTGGSAAAIEAKLTRLIEQRLLDNGFRRSEREPDFYVTYQLVQRRYWVVANEPSATYELSSLHASPSYVIERNRLVNQSYSELRLAIAAYRAGVGMIWHAKFGQNERELHAVKLDAALAVLLERLPRSRPGSPVRLANCVAETLEMDEPPERFEGVSTAVSFNDAVPGFSCQEHTRDPVNAPTMDGPAGL